jgi:proteasome activator subunit 4
VLLEQVGLSDALESTVTYQLNIVGDGISKGGHALLAHSELLKRVITAAFDAPSSKVNIAGSGLLICLLSSLSHYYITGSYPAWVGTDSNGIDLWYSTKGKLVPPEGSKLVWHLPSQAEIEFAEELLHLHLHKSLQDLRNMCQEVEVSGNRSERIFVCTCCYFACLLCYFCVGRFLLT